jgi:hypothetical protein
VCGVDPLRRAHTHLTGSRHPQPSQQSRNAHGVAPRDHGPRTSRSRLSTCTQTRIRQSLINDLCARALASGSLTVTPAPPRGYPDRYRAVTARRREREDSKRYNPKPATPAGRDRGRDPTKSKFLLDMARPSDSASVLFAFTAAQTITKYIDNFRLQYTILAGTSLRRCYGSNLEVDQTPPASHLHYTPPPPTVTQLYTPHRPGTKEVMDLRSWSLRGLLCVHSSHDTQLRRSFPARHDFVLQ